MFSFTSSNSSFIECVRKTFLQQSVNNNSYNTLLFDNQIKTVSIATQKSNEVTYTPAEHKELSNTDSFTSCEWINCEAASGGAIYFHDTSDSLAVSYCVFEKCVALSGRGGGIFALSSGKVSISQSTIIECSCPTAGTVGGGFIAQSASAVPEIVETHFLSCLASEDAGGVYILATTGGTNEANIPVRECRFLDCVARGDEGGYNGAEGGGVMYWENDRTLGISNSLFAGCISAGRAGGSFVVINNTELPNFIRFCFYHKNTAASGKNVALYYSGSGVTPWDYIFYHSYTSDTDLTYSLLEYPSQEPPERNDWLPQANINDQVTGTGRRKNIN